jgi:uncharacterized membrane protein YphA (DoxX/SURF4 family)
MGARYIIGLIASVLLGLILLTSGIGKLFMGVPAQLEFMSQISPVFGLPESWIKLLVYIIPWVEILLGLFLILQLFTSFVAITCVPLVIGFITNNVWMLMNGSEFTNCNSCFGVFEQWWGGLSPLQALSIDMFMFGLILVTVFVNTRYKLLWGVIKR